MTGHVLGFDVGGTGVRGSLGRLTATGVERVATHRHPTPVRMGPDGVDAASVLRAVTETAVALLPSGATAEATVIGCTGATLLGDALRRELPGLGFGGRLLLCSDVLTSYVGALGLGGGAVVAAGTGAVALGSDGRGAWQRADGYGVLLGDVGGGAWIGRAAVGAALRARDGRPGGSAALLAALHDRYGDPRSLVHAVTTRAERGALLASFAPDVAALAATDRIAHRILRAAGRHLADTLLAALPPGAPPVVAATGNLLRAGPPLTTALTRRVAARAPHLALRTVLDTSIDGAVTLAAAVVRDAPPPGAEITELTPAGTAPGSRPTPTAV
ncbi:BadF/BadG/BcrA/BcrD ATPase family protein [Micromonospora sp. NPDC050495]|uniref:BadF/BadG/BcrA/BcrD ATPase family protein n=1 Tax=Micromonospora sp. NPDC050495 TaxID=3154936 RepID=UPI00340B4CAE